jgi:hypothetical protein
VQFALPNLDGDLKSAASSELGVEGLQLRLEVGPIYGPLLGIE